VRRPVWMWDREVVVSEEERWWVARISEDIGRVEGRWFVKVREEGKIYTDALGEVGWCVVVVKGGETREMRGTWREEQRGWHINKKELWVGEVVVSREGIEKLGLKEGLWRWLGDN